MKKIFCLVGVPGSGKSTWVGIHNTDPSNSAVINMDTIRMEVTGNSSDQTQNGMVAAIARQNFLTAVSIGIPTIYWDNTTTQRKYRKEVIQVGKKAGYEVHAVYFNTPLDICLNRNKNRTRIVPEDVLVRMNSQIHQPDISEGWDNIITEEYHVC